MIKLEYTKKFTRSGELYKQNKEQEVIIPPNYFLMAYFIDNIQSYL